MNFLPFDDFVIHSPLSQESVLRRLQEVVEPRRLFRFPFWSQQGKPYEGMVSGSEFRIQRIISYRNSFLPEIYGQIESNYLGTNIHIIMLPNWLVLILTLVWVSVPGLVSATMAIGIVVTFFRGEAVPKDVFSGFFVGFGMAAFGLLLLIGGYKMEAVDSKHFLHLLFKSSPD